MLFRSIFVSAAEAFVKFPEKIKEKLIVINIKLRAKDLALLSAFLLIIAVLVGVVLFSWG